MMVTSYDATCMSIFDHEILVDVSGYVKGENNTQQKIQNAKFLNDDNTLYALMQLA